MTEKKLPVVLQPEKVTVSLAKFDAQIVQLEKKFGWSDEKLDEMLVHVDEKAVVEGAKKTCTELRTSITNQHKEVKAPYLVVTKAIDEAKNKAIAAVKKIEAPLDAAVLRRKKADEEAAKKAQAEKESEQEKEIARLKAKLAEAGVAEEEIERGFEEKALILTIETATQVKNLKALVGAKQFKELQFDEHGQPYVLKVTVTRDKFDEDC
jgi:nucleotide-binding universal stress UspA family protein